MIICKRCEFEVDASMRHSLVKNCCPACGAALLGDLYMRRFQLLKERILEQEFSQELNADLVFDITLFMLIEFFSSKPVEDSGEETSGEETSEEETSGEESEDFDAESYDDIRDEVRSEISSKMIDDDDDPDTDLKVARLKRIAKEQTMHNSGPTVRRVSD